MPLATMPWWRRPLDDQREARACSDYDVEWSDAEGLDRMLEAAGGRPRGRRVQPVVAETFAFDRAPDAHRFIAERRNVGKVVLTP